MSTSIAKYETNYISDSALVNAMLKVREEAGWNDLILKVTPNYFGSEITVGLITDLDEQGFAISNRTSMINRTILSSSTKQISLSVRRSKGNVNQPIMDVDLQYDGQLRQNESKQLFSLAQKHLPEKDVVIAEALGKEGKLFLRERLAAVDALTAAADKMMRESQEFVQKQEALFFQRIEERNTALENKYQSDIGKLELEKEHLKNERAEFEESKKSFEDRAARHIRRKIREDLKSIITQREKEFKLTEGTNKLRRPIHVVAIVSLAAFGIGAGIFMYTGTKLISELLTSGKALGFAELWPILIKQVTFVGAFASILFFYIRWTNSWFQQHAAEEFRHKRLVLDIDRASWLVELALEWKEHAKEDLPDEIVRAMSHNLFMEPAEVPSPNISPLDELASRLLGTASRVRLNLPDGSEIGFGKKDLKRLDKVD